jgi:hypothetical protein
MKKFIPLALLLLAAHTAPVCFCQTTRQPEKMSRPEFYGLAFWGLGHHDFLLSAILDPNVGEPREVLRATVLRNEIGLSTTDIAKVEKVANDIWRRSERLTGPEKEVEILGNLSNALSRKQQERYEALCCQLSGPMALRFKHYADRIGITEAQRKKVEEIVSRYDKSATGLHACIFVSKSVEEAKEPMNKLLALTLEMDKDILASLSEKQRTSWHSMLGKGFADWGKVLHVD